MSVKKTNKIVGQAYKAYKLSKDKVKLQANQIQVVRNREY